MSLKSTHKTIGYKERAWMKASRYHDFICVCVCVCVCVCACAWMRTHAHTCKIHTMTLVSLGSSGPSLTAAGEIELGYFCPTVRSRQCSRSLISPTKNFSGLYYRLRLFLTLLLFLCPSIGVRPTAQSKGSPASSCILCFFCFTSISPQYQCLQCGRPGFNPWVRKIPWRRKW